MNKIKREDLEKITKESLLEKFLQLQDLFFEMREILKPLERFHEKATTE